MPTTEQCANALGVIENAPKDRVSDFCIAALERAHQKCELDGIAAIIEASDPELFEAIFDAFDAFQAYN